ncbi:MAG: PAS domain-containing protein [Candidatus Schekmanbacteria bacterium]|nr:PAS domain-containing protein [Candidatus Schekmanbacteria bacterium]
MNENPAGNIERFISLLPIAVALIGTDGKIFSANNLFEEIAGTSSAILKSLPYRELFSTSPDIIKIIDTSLSKGEVCSNTRSFFYRRGKPVLPVEVSSSPVSPSAGVPGLSLVLLIKDNSVTREIESREDNIERIKNIESLSHWIIHEVRNPLGSIKGAAQMLMRDNDIKGDSEEFLEIILSEVTRLNDLTKELSLLLSKKEKQLENINIHAVLDHVIKIISLDRAAESATLTKEYDPSLPEISGNFDELIQVFQNIIKNAVQSQNSGGIINVRTRYIRRPVLATQNREDYGYIGVEVTDNGSGIDDDLKEKLFTPFFTTKKEGTGLGLAISLKIITEHNGFIEAENKPDGGALFRVILPYKKIKI